MDPALRRQLMAASVAFYRTHAQSFGQSRQGAWDSWDEVWRIAQQRNPSTVLDVGCGNGRFHQFLSQKGVAPAYTGIDSERQLIDQARRSCSRGRFMVATVDDVLQWPTTFDLVVCFGLFHHLAGSAYRLEVLQGLGRRLNSTGLLVASLWQPKLLANFSTKLCPDVAIEGMERNDYLLGWKGDCARPRYCHHFDDDEIQMLIDRSGLVGITQFQGSGNDRTNRYLVLAKP